MAPRLTVGSPRPDKMHYQMRVLEILAPGIKPPRAIVTLERS